MLSNLQLLLSTATQNPHFDADRPWALGTLTRRVKTKLGVAGEKFEAVLCYRRPDAEVAQFPEFIRDRVKDDVIFWSFRNGISTAVSAKSVRV